MNKLRVNSVKAKTKRFCWQQTKDDLFVANQQGFVLRKPSKENTPKQTNDYEVSSICSEQNHAQVFEEQSSTINFWISNF